MESYNQATLFLDGVPDLVWDETYSVDDDADELEERTAGGGAGQADDVEERDGPLSGTAEDTIEDFD